MDTRRFVVCGLLAALSACTESVNNAPRVPSAAATQGVDVWPWSEPVNGVQARVMSANLYGYHEAVFLEFRNTGPRPMTLAGLRFFGTTRLPWQLQVERAGQWSTIAWWEEGKNGLTMIAEDEPVRALPTVVKAGETALVEVRGFLETPLKGGSRMRFVVAQNGAGLLGDWSGRLETPPVAIFPPEAKLTTLRGKLALPAHVPAFDGTPMGAFLTNASGEESTLYFLRSPNAALVEQLELYDRGAVVAEMERRLVAERDFHVRLLIAAQAAGRGSTLGRETIWDALRLTEHEKIISALDALKFVPTEGPMPEWIQEAMIAALADQRLVTQLPAIWAEGTTMTISYLADEDAGFARRLGEEKCRRAVPVLLKLVEGRHNRNAIAALGEIGDPAAIPALRALVKQQEGELCISSDTLSPENYALAQKSLIKLKAPGVVDDLLKRVGHQDIVELLEMSGDARAVPVLKEIVATGRPHKITGNGSF